MGRTFNTARARGSQSPEVHRIGYTTGQTFKRGALVVRDANGTVVECGADPALIYGVALDGAGTGLGYDVANASQTTVYTGRLQEVSVAVASRESIFSCRGVNGGTDPVTPTQSHVGENYGVVKVGDDWCLDIAETVNTRAEIVDVDIDNKIFFVKILEANLDRP